MANSQTTTDHDFIKRWAEERGAHPTRVQGTDIIRLDFAIDGADENLEKIEWSEFFESFEKNQLAMLYDGEKTDSNFNKFIDR